MISPYGTLQEDAAAWLEDDDFLNDIIIVTEVRGNVQNRIDVALSQGAIHSQTPLTELAKPGDPNVAGAIAYAGTTILNGDDYSYVFSYKTAQGETESSGATTFQSSVDPGLALQIGFASPTPSRATTLRIWRTITNAGTEHYLLAEVELPTATNYYIDHETHAQFTARVDLTEVHPATNTTSGYEKKPGIAIVVRTPSSHQFGDARARVSRDTTLRVEVYAKPVVNDSANGTGKNPLDVSWAVERRMLNWNRGSGTYSTLFTAFDSEEVVKLGEIWYFNEFSVRHGVDLTQ